MAPRKYLITGARKSGSEICASTVCRIRGRDGNDVANSEAYGGSCSVERRDGSGGSPDLGAYGTTVLGDGERSRGRKSRPRDTLRAGEVIRTSDSSSKLMAQKDLPSRGGSFEAKADGVVQRGAVIVVEHLIEA